MCCLSLCGRRRAGTRTLSSGRSVLFKKKKKEKSENSSKKTVHPCQGGRATMSTGGHLHAVTPAWSRAHVETARTHDWGRSVFWILETPTFSGHPCSGSSWWIPCPYLPLQHTELMMLLFEPCCPHRTLSFVAHHIKLLWTAIIKSKQTVQWVISKSRYFSSLFPQT